MSITLLLLAVCVSAFVAHLAIDVIGDFALAHDTYDDIGHSSRIGTLVGASVFVLIAFFRLLGAALRKSPGDRVTLNAIARSLIKSPLRFGCAVALLSIVAVIGMEWSDAVLSGGDLDGFDDAFGGSTALGLSVTLAVSLVVSFAVVRFMRALGAPCEFVVEFLRVLAALPRHHSIEGFRSAAAFDLRPRRQYSVHARRAPKRGPPLLTA